MRVLLRWAIGAAALYVTVLLGQQLGLKMAITDVGGAFLAVLLLTLVNAFIRPVLKLVTLPLNCLTLGLFGFIVNALMFWLVGSLNLGLKVDGFWAALFGSVVLSVISGILNTAIVERGEARR